MYIVAIGWLYVTALMAWAETSVVAGVLTFLCYGLLPCSLVMWLGGTRMRRQRAAARARLPVEPASDAREPPSGPRS